MWDVVTDGPRLSIGRTTSIIHYDGNSIGLTRYNKVKNLFRINEIFLSPNLEGELLWGTFGPASLLNAFSEPQLGASADTGKKKLY